VECHRRAVVDLPETRDRSDAGLLVKFPQRRGHGSSPRSMPPCGSARRGFHRCVRPFGTPADEDRPALVEHHDADARTVGQILEARHIGRGMVQGARLRLRGSPLPRRPQCEAQFFGDFYWHGKMLNANGRRFFSTSAVRMSPRITIETRHSEYPFQCFTRSCRHKSSAEMPKDGAARYLVRVGPARPNNMSSHRNNTAGRPL